MIDKAYAKINLGLNVISKREDGYHELEMCMVAVAFGDILDIEIAQFDSYHCNIKSLVFDDNNLIYKMVQYLKANYLKYTCFKIKLVKRIPFQAGLAGGSSDAACALRIINKLCNLNLDENQIKQACEHVGSDVLFTYYNQPAIVKGKGDKLEFFNMRNNYDVLLVKPKKGVKTARCFALVDVEKCAKKNIDELKNNLILGKDIKDNMNNSLQEYSMKLNKNIEEIIDYFKSKGFDKVMMTGSGSCVFVIGQKHKLKSCVNHFKKRNMFCELTKTIN